jgi:hypothetical protein
MWRVLMATAMLFAATGCTRYWARPGGTSAEWEAARDKCETEAVTRFPLAPVLAGGLAYYAPVGSRCSLAPMGPTCRTYGGTEIDLNGQSRSTAFRRCLIEAGWSRARDQQEADAITELRRPVGPPTPAAVREARVWCDKWFNQRRNVAIMEVFHNSIDQCVETHSRDID